MQWVIPVVAVVGSALAIVALLVGAPQKAASITPLPRETQDSRFESWNAVIERAEISLGDGLAALVAGGFRGDSEASNDQIIRLTVALAAFNIVAGPEYDEGMARNWFISDTDGLAPVELLLEARYSEVLSAAQTLATSS